jgi:pyruvate ferredoxin oxidoreductase alpha subunit
MMGKTKHLLKPENAELLREIEAGIQERWLRIRARNDSPIL